MVNSNRRAATASLRVSTSEFPTQLK